MGTIFITNDWCIIEPGPRGLDPGDLEAMPPGAVAMTMAQAMREAAAHPRAAAPEGAGVTRRQLDALATSGNATYERCLLAAPAFVDWGGSHWIRELRERERLTWRSIARLCTDAWAFGVNAHPWTPLNNQLGGMAICQVAAERLGEDFRQPPWNGPRQPEGATGNEPRAALAPSDQQRGAP